MDDIKRTIDGKEICMCHNGVARIHDVVNNSAKCLSCIWRGMDLDDHNSPEGTHLIYCRKDNDAVNMYNAAGCSSFEQMTPEEFADFLAHDYRFAYKKIFQMSLEKWSDKNRKSLCCIGTDIVDVYTIHCDPETSELVNAKLKEIAESVSNENKSKLFVPLNIAMMNISDCVKYVKKKYWWLYDKLISWDKED